MSIYKEYDEVADEFLSDDTEITARWCNQKIYKVKDLRASFFVELASAKAENPHDLQTHAGIKQYLSISEELIAQLQEEKEGRIRFLEKFYAACKAGMDPATFNLIESGCK